MNVTRVDFDGHLELDRVTFDAIVEHARSDFPYEVCGLLAGVDGQVLGYYQVPNAARSMTYYNMDSKALLRAVNDIDEREWELIAIYHSHTHTEAFPSPTDIELAFYPQAIYLIVSLQDAEPSMRAFNIRYGEVTERVLTVDGKPAPAGSR